MSRTLSTNHMRMVLSGDDTAPLTMRSEYVVKVGSDLYETPGDVEQASPDFGDTMSILWQAAVNNAESDAGIV